ncbi:low affinity iron permease family protein [Brevundimonas sp. 2R-24]|uniref:Low affinity iron permease family protein n=1 Tax=Peiella sedimenti TaxID=3061083 RepID=A0ABT8SNP1_9CAUL|nr:low affinity iron permease family protein [Caulobacteraceae bacterium XZ-24]
MHRLFTHLSTAVARWAGRPLAFVLCLTIIAVWALTGPIFDFNDTWQLVINTGTTIVTFLMVFLIQNTQNRDNAALHAKLDELLHAVRAADERFVGIEHLTDKELEQVLEEVEARAQRLHRGPLFGKLPEVQTRAEEREDDIKSEAKGERRRTQTKPKKAPARP